METDETSPGANRFDQPQVSESGVVVRTFLIADVRGYTSFTQSRGDEAAGDLAAKFAALAREAVATTGGEVIELRGDEALCVFPSARQALRAAVELQIRFRERVEGQPVFPLGIGIGLAAGEAVPVEGGYRGAALNLAARLCSLASGGQILASEMVTGLAGTVDGVRFVERRRVQVKGLEKPVQAIEVIPEIELPPVPGVPQPRARRRRRLVLVAGAAILVGGVTAAVVGLTGGGTDASAVLPSVVPDSVAVIDPKTNGLVGQVQIPGRPSLVAAGDGLIWVASEASRTVSSISSGERAVTRVVAPNATPSALAADGDEVWVLDGNRRVLLKIDPAYGAVTRRIALPRAPPSPIVNQRSSRLSVVSGAGALWVTDGSTRLLRVDPETGRVQALDVGEPLNDVAVGAGSVWAISGRAATVFQIDTQGRAVTTPIRIVNRLGTTAPFPVAVAVGEGSVWVLNGNTQTVSRIDPEFGGVTASVALGVGRNSTDIAVGAGAAWVANGGDGTLSRIDPSTNSPATIPVGGSPAGVAVGGGRVWVTVQPGFRLKSGLVSSGTQAGTSAVGVPAISTSFCQPVFFAGKGKPQYLIASDLPFQGIDAVEQTLQMSDAIRFVLAKRGFTAGKYSIGFQSCDDSTAQARTWTPEACRRNARAYARQANLLGVIGTYNSGCSQVEIPILGAAPGGPVAIVSSASTYIGLTRSGPGSEPGEPGKYYSRGVRNFARVVPADHIQGAANAMLAKRLGIARLYVLHDGTSYGVGLAGSVRQAANKLGIEVAGVERWDARTRSYAALARRIDDARADAVFLGGLIDLNGAALVRDLKTGLGRGVRILASDGFVPVSLLIQEAGPAAEEVLVTFAGVAPSRLGKAGRQFVAEFEQAVGGRVSPYAIATAQAAEVLLDAIGRSDGTRASVVRELFKTRVDHGILGTFSFDRNGDTTAGSVTIFRVENGKEKVFAVITPPPSLVR